MKKKKPKYKSTKKFLAKDTKPFPFHLGSDPEFVITIQDKQVNAAGLIQKLYKQQQMDSTGMGYKIGTFGNIGWDGCSSTGEMRPSPSPTPLGHIKNIGGLLEDFAKRIQIFDLDTRSMKASAGGHIHFELPHGFNLSSPEKLNSLHRRLASFYLPLMLGDDPVSLAIRQRGSYGSINDKRSQMVGNGVYTYEFRTPSAEWLTTPEIAHSTLAYLGTVYHEIINNPKNFEKCKQVIFKNEKTALAMQELSKSNYSFVIDAFLNKVKKMIKTFEFYPEHAAAIDYILDYKRVYNDKQAVNWNILSGWKLANHKQPTKRDLLSDKKLEEKAKAVNLDGLEQAVYLPYNNDTNVADFAQAIKQRILAMNWKPKHNFFLFGLKKGLKHLMALDAVDNWYGDTSQLANQVDLDRISESFTRMRTKFRADTGQKKNNLLIGIPYDLRMERDYKKLIAFLVDIENGLVTHKAEDSLYNQLPIGDANTESEIKTAYDAVDAPPLINQSRNDGLNYTVTAEFDEGEEDDRDE
jgi:hypothetical protein